MMNHLFANIAYKLKDEQILIRYYERRLPLCPQEIKLSEGTSIEIPGHTEPSLIKEIIRQYGSENYLLKTVWKNVMDEQEIELHSKLMRSKGWNLFQV